jgi:hypothetical protein
MVRSRRHAAGAEQLVARVNDTQLRLGFVAAGLGLTLVPASVAELTRAPPSISAPSAPEISPAKKSKSVQAGSSPFKSNWSNRGIVTSTDRWLTIMRWTVSTTITFLDGVIGRRGRGKVGNNRRALLVARSNSGVANADRALYPLLH